ncbi:MarR family winged helix-turn-helix transcriptional regulator [Streptomyces sp. RKCA744]|uniref:MarR family winged helix-turn-helix transcriptional regulator n=1 Tax=Streptomyces sp. RKCA744 TaxID=2959340 RepID=UPI00209D4ED6|nr:MarR family transcriptional regulator [Streptomyces sp. RKCA744]MCO8308400.1 MarR family transcriptional regulator [Streptomyces sp. RKCA744]
MVFNDDAPSPPTASAVWAALQSYMRAQDRHRELRETVGLGRGKGRVGALLLIEQSARTLAELAQLLDIEPSHATIIVNTLEERGYVQRSPDPDDRRKKHVVLTDGGRHVLRRVHAVLDRPPIEFERLTPDDLATFGRLLAKLTDAPAE